MQFCSTIKYNDKNPIVSKKNQYIFLSIVLDIVGPFNIAICNILLFCNTAFSL